ncbi:MAG: DUF29 domain-containing protein [Gemmatimonadaceae bacterium]|nr:DUF29 domain-containing protein [Gloeobacterales cyanobacterium ES-bin-141]
MDVQTNKLTAYDQDFHAWANEQAELVRSGRLTQLDLENVAEELEGLARRDRREIASRLDVLLMHLLKWAYQPQARSNSWKATILEQRQSIFKLIEESPSLNSYPERVLDKEYALARDRAAAETGLPVETFPGRCPFSIEQVLDSGRAIDNPDLI